MSSATNNRRGSLEEEFRHRMQDAEASPSADLWARIDHTLTVQESGQYKRGMLFYRQLAAACATLLLVAGGFAAYYFGGSTAGSVAPAGKASAPMAAAEESASQLLPATDTDKAIADAMQEAVRPQEPVRQRVALSPEATAQPAAAAGAAIAATEAEPASEAGNWHKVPAGAATSLLQDEQVFMGQPSARNLMPGLRQHFPGKPDGVGFAGTASSAFSQPATNDFRELNQVVMSRVKELQAEQEAMKQQYKSERALASSGKKEQESASGRWSLGMAYAPSYFEQNIGIPSQMMMGMDNSTRFFGPPTALQQSTALMADAREEYEEEVEPGFSFGVEVKSGFKIGKKWKLLAGLGFTQNNARSKSSYIIQQFWRKPESGQQVSPGPTTIFLPSLSSNFASDSLSVAKTDEFDVMYRYRHLTVPVGMQYEGNLGKDWFWFAGGGVAANVLLQTSVMASSADVRDIDYELRDDHSPFRKLQWSGNVTAGVGKRLTDNMSLAIGPEYRGYFDTMLSSPEKAQAPQGKPYTLGINMALNYDLGPGRK